MKNNEITRRGEMLPAGESPGRLLGEYEREGTSLLRQRFSLLERTVQQHQPSPVVALLDVVRRHDYDRVLAVGASVIAKPLLVNDLLWQLDAAIGEIGHLPAVSSVA